MIPKEEASCIFYCRPFNEKNAEECFENIRVSPEVDLCYTNNSHEPMLICKSRIYGAPNLYKMYKTKQEITEEIENNADNKNIIFGNTKKQLENDSQIVDFINYNLSNKLSIIRRRYRLKFFCNIY